MLCHTRKGTASLLPLISQLERCNLNLQVSIITTTIDHLLAPGQYQSYTTRSSTPSFFTTPPVSLQHQHFLASSSFSTTSTSAPSSSRSTTSTTTTWVDALLPTPWQPYAKLMRLDRPIGTWLLLLPSLWSLSLAAPPGHLPDPYLLCLFSTGAILLRGAGCTINDLWDRDIDKQVERTKLRPIASGQITVPAAITFLGCQLTAGLGILLQLNTATQALGVSSLGLVVLYPLMKRVTGWPQLVLGLAMNWGVLMGWSAVTAGQAPDLLLLFSSQNTTSNINFFTTILPLYSSGILWTLIYDTIYAHQDKADDAKVGVKSTALTFGNKTKAYLSAFAVGNMGLLAMVGQSAGCGLPYYASVLGCGMHLAWQICSVDLDNGVDCMRKFVSNKWYGGMLFAGIAADKLLLF